jgi:hypothetical protein
MLKRPHVRCHVSGAVRLGPNARLAVLMLLTGPLLARKQWEIDGYQLDEYDRVKSPDPAQAGWYRRLAER